MSDADVMIIGGGVAGLSASLHLAERGLPGGLSAPGAIRGLDREVDESGEEKKEAASIIFPDINPKIGFFPYTWQLSS